LRVARILPTTPKRGNPTVHGKNVLSIIVSAEDGIGCTFLNIGLRLSALSALERAITLFAVNGLPLRVAYFLGGHHKLSRLIGKRAG
jgi:hypothetical protein